jgi:MATE family multidrug resistance protein
VDLRAIAILAAPLMATNATQAVLNLTDTWFLGRLSTSAVAAMGSIYWVMTCVIIVLGGVSLAVQTFVAQAVGRGDGREASHAAWNALWAAAFSVPVFVLLAAAGPWLVAPFGLDPEVERLAMEYWRPRMWGAALGLASWSMMSFFTGVGETRTTFVVALVTTIANVPANQLLMFEAGLGMAGAAWGTNVAQLIGLATGLALFLARDHARRFDSRHTWRLEPSLLVRELKVGLPVGVMYGADLVGVALLQMMIAQTGTGPGAASQIVFMLTSLAYMPAVGIASTGTTLVGQSIGAGDHEWARRVGNATIGFAVAFMGSVALILLVAGPWLLPLFVPAGDPAALAAVATGLVILWPAAAYQAFDGMYFGASSALRGAGDTRVPAATALLLSWFLFVPLAHALVFATGEAWVGGLPQAGLGALGGWLALMTYAMLLGLGMLWRWRSGRWVATRI